MSRQGEPKARVIQMMPADGWRAVFADGSNPIADPLVCWALVEFFDNDHGPRHDDVYMPAVVGSRQAIVGMITGIDGWVDCAEGNGNFLGYAAAGEPLEDWAEKSAEYTEDVKRQREAKP